MARDNVDDILNELGLDDDALGHAPRRSREPSPRRSREPSALPEPSSPGPEAFSPLPAVPANQDARPIPKSTLRAPSERERTPEPPKSQGPTTPGNALLDVYTPDGDHAPARHKGDLGDFLVADGSITREQLTAAYQVIKQGAGESLAHLLMEQGADEERVQRAVAQRAGVAFEHIDLGRGIDGGFDGALLQRLTPDYCKQQAVLPLRREGQRVFIAALSPDDAFVFDEVRRKLGVPSVKPVLVMPSELKAALDSVSEAGADDVDLSEILADVEEGDVEVSRVESDAAVDLEQQAGESPVIRYVNYIIQTAVKEGASDIHIEPTEKKMKVRFRIDGVLYEMMNPPRTMAAAITSRLKIMGNLDISERRLPQDGRIRCVVQGRKLDLRVSTLPTPVGEKVVMRILDTRSINVELEQLGFDESTLDVWKTQIKNPHGIILVTGPTGSGKTTTLYASIRQLDKNKLNISTVEDPVEYHLDGITQTQTHDKVGMTFAKALRALLRQDPDVIMLGEIRDHETAHIAIQAALTGHLVLSTLHTNDAPSSVTRLVNIGLEPFLVGAAVNAIIAQRLARRLCQVCKVEEAPSEEFADYLEMQGMPVDKLWQPKGCDKCRNTGYSGRVGLYELLVVDDHLRDIVARNPNVSEFRRLCCERGMKTLRQDGLNKISQGLTTIQEIFRVTEATL